MVAMTIDDRGTRIARTIALLVFVVMFALPSAAQEKFRFPIGESSKTLSYGPLWVAAKMGFFERESLDVPIITMRGSPLTIQALTTDSIFVASAESTPSSAPMWVSKGSWVSMGSSPLFAFCQCFFNPSNSSVKLFLFRYSLLHQQIGRAHR